MKRVVIKLGDVFAAKLDDRVKKYFQYIGDDMTMLNSRVIRAFKEAYPVDATPALEDVVAGEVDFHAHVVIRWGLQMGLWEKVGKVKFTGTVDVLFRSSSDYGDPGIRVSEDWYVWKINEPMRQVGRLTAKYQHAEIGEVIAPHLVFDRMRTGKYHFVYPGF